MPRGQLNDPHKQHPQSERKELRRKESERQMRLAGKNAGAPMGEYRLVPANTLKKSALYQRPFRQERAIEIAYNFNWIAFHALSVARRPDGSLYFMDGQHRLQAAMMAYNDRIPVPCMVYDVPTEREEAWVFNRVNIDRAGLSNPDKWHSRKGEGDAYVEAVESLLAEYGLSPAPMRGRTAPEPGQVVAVFTLERQLKKAGEESVRETLGNIYAVFGDNPDGYKEHFLRGVWNFIIRFPQYNPKRLRTVMMRKGVNWRPEFTGMDEGLSMALDIWTAYNYKEAPEHRLPPFPMTPKGHRTGQETNRAALEYRRVRNQQGAA